MANIPLKTIKFPGLDDTYTVPQIDSSFTGVAGEAPDSNKVKGEIDSLKENMPIAGTKQFINPDTVVVENIRITSAGKIIADNNYKAIIVPASVKANKDYRAKYFGNSATFDEFRLYTSSTIAIDGYVTNKPNLYDYVSSRVQTTEDASYFILVLHITSGTVSDAIAGMVITQAEAYPTEYTPYYVSVDDVFVPTINGIKSKLATAGKKQLINPDTVSIINVRVSVASGNLIADNNYRSLIIPATIKANSEYRAKYLGNQVTFDDFKLFTFDDADIGEHYVDATNLYGADMSRIQTTAVANYFVLYTHATSGNIETALPEIVLAESTEYPTEYTPYYISVDEAINNSIGKYTSPDCIEVGTNSDKYEYTDINSAVVANPNSIIHVNYGTYETEVVGLTTNKKLIGKDRDLCILTGTNKDYDTPPIEIAGGIVKNFTVNMINDSEAEHKGYCLHSDNSATANNTLLVENCKFDCTGQHSVGLGIRSGETVIFEDCVFEQNDGVSARVPIYIHNSNGTNPTVVKFHGCYFKGYDYCMKLQAWAAGNPVQFEFIDCTCISEVYGTADDCVWTDHVSGDTHDTTKMHSFSGKFTLLPTSHGNNISVLNAS